MNPDDLKLSSVNWEHGMLLTPRSEERRVGKECVP